MLAHPPMPGVINADLDATQRYRTKMRSLKHNVAVPQSEYNVVNTANSRSALYDGI
jgi:hypothetical protein